jgi:hypothetical protein
MVGRGEDNHATQFQIEIQFWARGLFRGLILALLSGHKSSGVTGHAGEISGCFGPTGKRLARGNEFIAEGIPSVFLNY